MRQYEHTPQSEDESDDPTDGCAYHRFPSAFWRDRRTAGWSQDLQFLFVYLYTSPHRTTEGIFRQPIPYMMADLRWSRQKIIKALGVLQSAGFISFDFGNDIVLLREALRIQFPANPNGVTGAIRKIRDLPDTPLLQEFYDLALRYSDKKKKGEPARMAQRFVQLLTELLSKRTGYSLTLTPTRAEPLTGAQARALSPSPPLEPDFSENAGSSQVGRFEGADSTQNSEERPQNARKLSGTHDTPGSQLARQRWEEFNEAGLH